MMMVKPDWRWLALLVPLAACGGDYAEDGDAAGINGSFADGGAVPECFSSNECPTGYTCSDFGVCLPPSGGPGQDPEPPPEIELDFAPPLSAQRYVYVALPELESVARIDGSDLSVTSLVVGRSPEVIAVAPGSDVAVVLDSENAIASIVRPDPIAESITVVATQPSLNRLAIDPTGRFAVAWFELDAQAGFAGVGSFQDVTVIDLTPGLEHAVSLTVGFRPREVEFDEAGQRAYVITDDGVSVVDMEAVIDTGPTVQAPIPLTDGLFASSELFDVDIDPSGAVAVARESGTSTVRIVSMLGPDAGQRITLDLDGPVSDLDISRDGTEAFALVRSTSSFHRIDLTTGETRRLDLGGPPFGSLVLDEAGGRAVVFTNATNLEAVALVDLETFTQRSLPLQKSVRQAGFSPDGGTVLVIHAKEIGDPDTATGVGEFIDRSHGFSLVDVDTGFAKLQVTESRVGSFVFRGGSLYISTGTPDSPEQPSALLTADLGSGVVTKEALQTPPIAVGVLPAVDTVFVGQVHPLGRMSFIKLAAGVMQTITGFDLNSRVVD